MDGLLIMLNEAGLAIQALRAEVARLTAELEELRNGEPTKVG